MTSTLLRRSRNRVGKYTSSAARETIRMMNSSTGLLVVGSLKRHLEEQGFSFNTTLDNKSIYDVDRLWTCYDKYLSSTPTDYDGSCLDQAYALTKRQFSQQRRSLRALPLDEGLVETIRGSKSSGAPSFTQKSESFDLDLSRALRISRDERAPDPCVAYHRIQHGDEGPKTRLVWGYPQSMTLLEARFARPLTDHFICYDTNSPMVLGKRRHEIGALMQKINNGAVKYGLDYSGFDSSIRPRFIALAFEFFRSLFVLNEEEQAAWDKVVWYFIHTPILMPDGCVYKKHQGVPSGSYFTQLIDSFVCAMSINYISIRLFSFGIHNDGLLVLGDDSVFALHTFIPLERIANIAKELGLKLNIEKSIVTDGAGVHFLGHEWVDGLVHRKPQDIAKRVVFPERINPVLAPAEFVATRMYATMADSVEGWKIYNDWATVYGCTPDIFARCSRSDVRVDQPVFGFQTVQEMNESTPWFDPIHARTAGSIRMAYLGLIL